MIGYLLAILLISRVASADADTNKKNGCLSDSELLANILSSAGNIGEQPIPNNEGSQDDENANVLNILIGLDVNYFNIIPHTSSLEIDGTILREWKHPSLYFSHLKPCHTSITLTHLKHQLWVPQLSFVNAADIVLHSHSVRIRLHEDGTISHTERVKQSVPCKTQASTYPFGNTTCTLLWRNDDITRDTASIKWKSIKSEGHEAGDLVLSSATTSVDDALTQSGVSDELSLVYTFTRGPNKILLLFYFPTIIFMIISWVSLLLGPMAITRVIMSMLSLVLLFLSFASNMADLPRTNGITSIDVWKLFSLIFVLVIILELVVVTLMASIGRSRSCCRSRRSHHSGKYEIEPLYEEMNDLRQRKTRKTCSCCRISAMVLDIVTFALTGIIFAAFLLAYHFERDVMINFLNHYDIGSLKFF